VAFVELMTREVGTVRYEYNAASKAIEPIKERLALAKVILELPQRQKPKPLTRVAAR
jgi:hypothetical protein